MSRDRRPTLASLRRTETQQGKPRGRQREDAISKNVAGTPSIHRDGAEKKEPKEDEEEEVHRSRPVVVIRKGADASMYIYGMILLDEGLMSVK